MGDEYADDDDEEYDVGGVIAAAAVTMDATPLSDMVEDRDIIGELEFDAYIGFGVRRRIVVGDGNDDVERDIGSGFLGAGGGGTPRRGGR